MDTQKQFNDSYSEAIEAKRVLLEYLKLRGIEFLSEEEISRDRRNEMALYLALTAQYFLD